LTLLGALALIVGAYATASIAAPGTAPAADALAPQILIPTLHAVGSDRTAVYMLTSDDETRQANLTKLGARWWSVFDDPLALSSDRFKMRVLRMGGSAPLYTPAQLAAAAAAAPGASWEFGNEPNVPGQDNVNPATYATRYKSFYD